MDISSVKRSVELVHSSTLSARNKMLLLQFKDECLARGLGHHRVSKYLSLLRKLLSWLDVDADRAAIEDIKRVVAEVETAKYTAWTKSDHKLALRMFFTFLAGGQRPATVSWIRIRPPRGRQLMPTDLLTPDDVKALIAATQHPRDSAFVALLYESGARIGEMLGLRIGDIALDAHGAQAFLRGKTGHRRIRLVSSVPYLSVWLNTHPRNGSPDSPLWVSRDGRVVRLDYAASVKVLRRAMKRAGISKPANPHHFRHSRATFLANHLTDAQMKEYLGWVQGSNMAAVYVHLSGRDVDNAILAIHGIAPKSEATSDISNKTCVRCQRANPATYLCCMTCGLPLDDRAATALNGEQAKQEALVAAAQSMATNAPSDFGSDLATIIAMARLRAQTAAADREELPTPTRRPKRA